MRISSKSLDVALQDLQTYLDFRYFLLEKALRKSEDTHCNIDEEVY